MISNPNYFVFNTNSSVGSTGPTGPTGATSTVTGPTGWTGPTGPTGITIMTQTSNAALVGNIASPYLNQYVQDGNGYLRKWDGSTWMIVLASNTYAPTLSPMVVGTGGTNTAYWTYTNSGNSASSLGMITIEGRMVFGTSGQTFPSTPNTLSYPTGFTGNGLLDQYVGGCNMSVAGAPYGGFMVHKSGTTMAPTVFAYNPTAATTPQFLTYAAIASGIPGTWTANNWLYYQAFVPGTLAI